MAQLYYKIDQFHEMANILANVAIIYYVFLTFDCIIDVGCP